MTDHNHCSAANEDAERLLKLVDEIERQDVGIVRYVTDEIKKLRVAVEYWRLAAERREVRREITGLDIPEAQTLDAPDLATQPQPSAASEPVAYRVKDFADGWILCHTREVAEHEADGQCLIEPLYRAVPQAAEVKGGAQ